MTMNHDIIRKLKRERGRLVKQNVKMLNAIEKIEIAEEQRARSIKDKVAIIEDGRIANMDRIRIIDHQLEIHEARE